MAFLKFSRDKRGYENFYLLQPTLRGKSRPRLLYWFHTPPNVKVGRAPFDPEVRHALEAQNPDVAFDWTAIVQTPIPPADTERWRERRRAERAMRAASESESAAEAPDAESGEAEPEQPAPGAAARDAGSPTDSIAVSPVLPVAAVEDEPTPDATAGTAATSNPVSPAPDTAGGVPARRRRRRRRGRRKPQAQVPGSGSPAPGSEALADAVPANDSEAPGDPGSDEAEPESEP